jgi:hypothetical protein
MALLSPADELYYGGQAGGGKTDFLLGCALTQHIDSLIFRREYAQMTGAQGIIDRSREIIGDRGRYNGQEHVWRDLPGGRSLEFGSMPREYDKHRYMGRPHDFVGFDEITEILQSQYEFVIRWNRTTVPGQRCRVVCAGNPPMHADGRWVIEYWAPWIDKRHANPAQPGELRYFVQIDGKSVEVAEPGPIEHNGETLTPRSRTFIPATLADNPYLGEEYAALLADAPEPLRSQLLLGDFTAGIADDAQQVIPTAWVEQAQARWKERKKPDTPLSTLGVDVARGGKDQTVLAPRFDNWYAPLQKHPGVTTPDGPSVAALTIEALGANRQARINIDVIGVGSSAYDILANQQGLYVIGVNFAAGTNARDKSGQLALRNKRAQAYWQFREALDPKTGDDIALPDDPELLADLTAPRWKLTTSGILIESKEDIMKRIGRSPDCGDAVVLAAMQEGILIG